MLRNWILARDARKLARRTQPPQHIERMYWTGRDYERDSARLAKLGYVMVDESRNAPYVGVQFRARSGYSAGRVVRRRVPIFHVTYGRRPSTADKDAD